MKLTTLIQYISSVASTEHRTFAAVRGCLLLFLIAGGITIAGAQHLSVHHFTPDDGIPSEACFPMFQDSYGIMWFATEQGPVAFDGSSFTPFSRAQHYLSDVVTGVEDAAGDLWMGGINGFYHGVRSKQFPLQFRWEPLHESTGTTIRWISDVELSKGGGIFYIHSGRIYCWSKNLPIPCAFTLQDGQPLNLSEIHDLLFDKKGRMWFGSGNLLYRTEESIVPDFRENIVVRQIPIQLGGGGFGSITLDSTGRVWIQCGSSRLLGIDTLDVISIFGDIPTKGDRIINIQAGGGNDIWICGDTVLFHLTTEHDPKGHERMSLLSMIGTQNGLPVGGVLTGIYVDHDGNIWTHQTYTGPARINLRGFTLYGPDIYGREDASKIVLCDSSDILFSCLNNYVARFGKRVYGTTSFRSVEHIQKFASGVKRGSVPLKLGGDTTMLGFHKNIFSLLIAHAGEQARMVELKFRTAADVIPGTLEDRNDVQSMFRDREGNIYVGENYLGVLKCRLVGDELLVTRIFRYAEGGGFRSTRAITQTRDGAVWFGGFFDGLTSVRGDTIQTFTIAEGLTDNAVRSLLEDKRGTLWIGTRRGGLTMYRNRQFSEPLFLNRAPNTIWCMEELSDGSVWAGTDEGLISLSKGLSDEEVYRIRYFNIHDGLPRQRVVAITSDERQLYVAAIGGLYVAERQFLMSGIGKHLRPYFKSIRLNGIEQADSSMLFPAGEHTISVSFGVVDQVSSGSVFYQYRIGGSEGAWSNPVSQTEVTFAGLSPGSYRFELRAAEPGSTEPAGDDSISFSSTGLSFSIATPFYRTTVAYMIFGLLAIGSAGLVYQIRVRHILRLERIRAEENERLRRKVAADFHDEFGHRLAKINLFSEILKTKQITPELRDYLDRIIVNAQGTYNGVRDFLWTLNPENDTVGEVAIRLKKFGDELFEKTGIAFRLLPPPVEIENLHLSMDWRRHIILIFQEALTNTLKHSGATHAELSVTDRPGGAFEITLRDDGRGIPEGGGVDGIGLRSMQTRAAAVGGSLLVGNNQSSGEGGTVITFLAKTP